MNFENLTVVMHFLYVFNIPFKFYLNRMLFTVQLVNLFFMIILNYKNLKFKHLINDITICVGQFCPGLQQCKGKGPAQYLV